MELCKRFGGATQGEFTLIDTPGPDEANQGQLLEEAVKAILQEADAVICVVNGTMLRNQAQASVRDMIKSKLRCDMLLSTTSGWS